MVFTQRPYGHTFDVVLASLLLYNQIQFNPPSLRLRRCRKNLPLGDPDQLNANPYEPTDLTPSERSALPPKSWHLRAAICVHLFAVGASIVVSRIDTGMLDLPGPVETFAYSTMYPCLLAMFVCPVVVLHYALRSTLSPLRRILVIAVDACVVFAHFFALIPLVQ